MKSSASEPGLRTFFGSFEKVINRGVARRFKGVRTERMYGLPNVLPTRGCGATSAEMPFWAFSVRHFQYINTKENAIIQSCFIYISSVIG